MRTLSRTALRQTSSGEPLPVVFPMFDVAGIKPRRGTVTMLAATPASAKTFLMMKWAQKMGLSTLFFSADTDDQTITERMAAIITKDSQADIRDGLRYGGADHYADALAEGASHIRWVFESDPSYDDIVLETAAFAEAFGDFPEVIVIDNLMNVVPDSDDEFGGMRETTKVMHRLVRVTGSAVFVLHHASESVGNGTRPSPRKAIQGKVSQLPEVILSLARDGDELRIAVVKNRFGPQDPTGENYITLYADLDHGQFYNGRHEMEMGLAL